MTSETQQVIAFVFNRSGKKEMSFSEFYLTLSMGLNWFTPEEAKKFMKHALDKKLLIKNNEHVKPNFDIEDVVIPVGFYPSKKILEDKIKMRGEKEEHITGEEHQDVLEEIIHKIMEKTQLEEEEVVQKIKNIERERNIFPEIAAILVGKEYNVNLTKTYVDVEKKLFNIT